MFRVSLVQLDTIYKDPAGNRNRIRQLVDEMCPEAGGTAPVDLIVFPETCTAGYSEEVFKEIGRFAEENGGETLRLFQELAASRKVCICTGSFPEKEGDRIYNTVWFVDRTGRVISKYRKMHLYSAG